MKIKRKSAVETKVEPKDTITILSEAIIGLQEEVQRLNRKVNVDLREELKELLKQGKIRFEIDLDEGGYNNYLEVKLDVFIDNDWVADTKSEVYFQRD